METQQTLIKKSTNNPAWNENFKFPVRNPLNSFINQEKNTKWFDLHLDDSDGKNRQIKLKVQFTYSLKKYYLEQIEKNQKNDI